MKNSTCATILPIFLFAACASEKATEARYPEDGDAYEADPEQTMQPAAGQPEERLDEPNRMRSTTVELQTSDATQLQGQANFDERETGVWVRLTVQHAEPGKYAVHIHERDDCSDIPGKSMGGHFDPRGQEHGLPHQDEHHLGDLGNLEVNETGTGSLEILVPEATLEPNGEMSFLGRAIVIHTGADDGGGTSGHSGKPMACGPIRPE